MAIDLAAPKSRTQDALRLPGAGGRNGETVDEVIISIEDIISKCAQTALASASMESNAARGFSAWVIGRPITRKSAPLPMALAGVAIRA